MLRLRPTLKKLNCVIGEIVFSQSQFAISQFSQSILQPWSKLGLCWANPIFKHNPIKIIHFIFRIQRPEMEVARAKIYPAECLRVFYLKYFRTQKIYQMCSLIFHILQPLEFLCNCPFSHVTSWLCDVIIVLLRGFGETRDLTCSFRANRTFHLYLGCPMTSSMTHIDDVIQWAFFLHFFLGFIFNQK